jgi:3-oxoacyl-[acyl-carrier protein] reductase
MNLAGHKALITGAGQGIGRACAEVFASRGADLVLLDKNSETLNALAEKLTRTGRSIAVSVLDLTDFDLLQSESAKIIQQGLIDILVNNAGFDRPGTSAKISMDEFWAVLGIHLTAPLFLIRALLPPMRAAKWGRIINVSSIYGLIGEKGELSYSTAKAGLIGMTKSLAKECGKDGVTVNAVLPGLTQTPTIEKLMGDQYKETIITATPLGRMAEAEEVATVIAFLASDDASFITGAALPVSGGWGI